MKVIPVTCPCASKPELKDKATEAIKVHQNNQEAVDFGLASSCILEAVLLGSTLKDALAKCSKDVTGAVATSFQKAQQAATSGQAMEQLLLELSHELKKDEPDSPFYDLAGRSCALPGSFTVPVYEFYKAAAMEEDDSKNSAYVQALRENILGAGDTCSRGQIIGAILAASHGGPPEEWVAKMDQDIMKKVDAAASAIADTALREPEPEL